MANFIKQESLNLAVLYRLFELAQTSHGSVSADNLAKIFDIPIGSKRVTLAFEQLCEKDLVKHGPNSWYSITSKGYEQVEKALSDQGSLIFWYSVDGDKWLSGQTIDRALIPASDRIVSRADNQRKIEEVSIELDKLVETLERDNEVGAELGDDRELILREAVASRELISGDKFYLRKLFQLISPALKFLSEKFSGAAIGEAAKHLFNLIMALF